MRRAAALVVLLSALAFAPSALADGDPASDVLIYQNVYFPYQPRVSQPVGQALVELTKEAQQAGVPIRVALIATANDLGAVPQLFGKPRQYARFLSQELLFAYRGVLIVAMPSGVGVRGPVPAAVARRVVRAKPPGANADAIATAASRAVRAVAAGTDHPLGTGGFSPIAGGGGGSSSGGGSEALIAGLAGGGAVVIGGGIGLHAWRSSRRRRA